MKYYAEAIRLGPHGSASDSCFVGGYFLEDAEAVEVLTARAVDESESRGDYSVVVKVWRYGGDYRYVGDECQKVFDQNAVDELVASLKGKDGEGIGSF